MTLAQAMKLGQAAKGKATVTPQTPWMTAVHQTDSGQNKLPPSADRWRLRSKTYQGIADAMASQWG